MDELQLLQPGFDTQWIWNVEEEAKATKEKVRQRVALALQRSNQAAAVAAAVQALPVPDPNNPGNFFPPAPPPAIPKVKRKGPKFKFTDPGHIGGGGTCEFTPTFVGFMFDNGLPTARFVPAGRCLGCEIECQCVDLTGDKACPTCHRLPQPVPESESKFSYLVKKLEELRVAEETRARAQMGPAVGGINVLKRQQLKVLVFSQFKGVLDTAINRLVRLFGAGRVAEYTGRDKDSELKRFKDDKACLILCAGGDAARGLDLSYLSHIFLFDEIYDAALKKQIVARAYRMGAVGAVKIETLRAKGSCEAVERGGGRNLVWEVEVDGQTQKVKGDVVKWNTQNELLKGLTFVGEGGEGLEKLDKRKFGMGALLEQKEESDDDDDDAGKKQRVGQAGGPAEIYL